MIQEQAGNNALIKQLIAWTARGTVDHAVEVGDTPWQELVQLGMEQHVLSLLGCALIRSKDETCPQEIKGMLTDIARQVSAQNLIRRQRMLYLIDEMTKAGINVLVLKGYAVAAYYAYPECRDSTDVDLLIDARQERKATAFLKAKGFAVEARAATSQHAVCVHAQYGKIELHVSLYAEFVRDVWFQGKDMRLLVCEPFIVCHTPDGAFTTLGYTDHLIFLTLHMMKHFIESGMTLRMMLDIALFFSKNVQQIDAGRFWNVMNSLQYATMINGLLWIMIRYAGFSEKSFPGIAQQEPAVTEDLLNDLAQGGYMGALERENRYDAGMEYNKHLMLRRKNVLQYRGYVLRRKIRTARKYMFMSYERLSAEYQWLEKASVLYPFIWFYQIFAYPASRIKCDIMEARRSALRQMDPRAKTRMTLFEKMRML